MSEGNLEITHERDYEDFVLHSRRSWWNSYFQNNLRLAHVLDCVQRDFENMLGVRIL